ncbi:uncharacterized protein LOC113466266 [Diaphorina citri]|uniref:Uncharacterized protein LOC113466266 n=1 Tax=Diaphorina citri TaxID=121845 RepID=A0A3Q0IRQ1_DIACI|nr:uncharacterized protein LOC113466266 [Diaphorina citri]
MSGSYKYCVVPECTSTTVATPDKLFIHVPKDVKQRKLWLTAMRRADPLSNRTSAFVCEDHFNLEQDMENYVRFQIMKKGPIRLHPGVIPQKFICQQSRTTAHIKPPRQSSLKRKHQAMVQDLLSQPQPCTSSTPDFDEEQLPESDFIDEVQVVEDPILSSDEEYASMMEVEEVVATAEKSTDTRHLLKFRSKEVQFKPLTKDRGSSPIIMGVHQGTSPIKLAKLLVTDVYSESEEESTETCEVTTNTVSSDYTTSGATTTTNEVETKKPDGIKERIMEYPLFYIGIPNDVLFLLDILVKSTNQTERDVLLCLKKLRLNEPYIILGQDFKITPQHAGAIFHKVLPSLAKALEKFIIWPTNMEILHNLPIAFRYRYSKVVSIIDCFEVEIEKPTNSLHQALTWSEYKKCNTIKYLIACTPDGLCSFVSSGFGGRTTDSVIVKESGFLNKIKPGMHIMADRGFKNVEKDIAEKGGCIVRPPSTSQESGPMNKKNARRTKQIAALRIHIERVIGRLRHFNFLAPHCCLDNKLIPYLDCAVIVACSLINVQSPLIQS